eukprot:4248092-Pyramimonas_sp.AAC.1
MKTNKTHTKFTPFFIRRFGVFPRQKSTQKSTAARLQGQCSDISRAVDARLSAAAMIVAPTASAASP